MKRKIIFLLCIMMLLSLFGCTKQRDSSDLVVLSEKESEKNDDSVKSDEIKSEIKNDSNSTDENSEADVTVDKKNSESSEQEAESNEQADVENNNVTEKEDELNTGYDLSDDAYKVLPGGVYNLRSNTSDTFLCKVLDATPIKESLDFPVFGGFEDNNVIYTVYIEKVYRSTFSEESTTINVISRANDKDKWWVSPYEIGQRYIITGLVQPYKKTPIMVDSMSLSAHVAVDGSLTPQSYSSKHTLGDIQTINELENNADVRKLFAYKYDLLDTIADDYEQTRLDGVSPENGTTLVAGDKQILVKSDDEVVKYIKDAIIIDTPSNVATAPITK